MHLKAVSSFKNRHSGRMVLLLGIICVFGSSEVTFWGSVELDQKLDSLQPAQLSYEVGIMLLGIPFSSVLPYLVRCIFLISLIC